MVGKPRYSSSCGKTCLEKREERVGGGGGGRGREGGEEREGGEREGVGLH